jgi:hypothetical protein
MIWLTLKPTFRAVGAFLLCARSWSSVLSLHKRGGIFHYDFAIDGRRFRGTTKEKTASRARMIEAALINEARQRKLTVRRRSLTLAEFSSRFLQWVT